MKDETNKKEGTMNKFHEKHEYELEKEAENTIHTDVSINDKNPKSRNEYRQNQYCLIGCFWRCAIVSFVEYDSSREV